MAFIRKKRIGNVEYFYLVESARVDGKPRQRVIAYLGQFSTVKAAYNHWKQQLKGARDAGERQHAREMLSKLEPHL